MTEAFEKIATQYPDLVRFEKHLRELLGEGYFRKNTTILINRTPGRLDLMGGNDDYTGGLVFETTIREATFVAIQPRADQTVTFYNPAVKSLGWSERVEFTLNDLTANGTAKPLEEVRSWINSDPARGSGVHISLAIYIS